MAEEGGGHGSYKAVDFYLGVVDLFSILLPGAMLAFLAGLCIPWSSSSLSPVNRALSEPFARYAAFVILAYVLGHFLSALGSTALDHVYDRWYKRYLGKKLNHRREQVKPILARTVGAGTNDNSLDWTLAVIRVRAPGAFTQLDRFEADSKFFRSVTVVLLLAWPLLLFAKQGYWSLEGAIALLLVLTFFALQALDKPLHEEIRGESRFAEKLHGVLQWSPVVWFVVVASAGVIVLSLGRYEFGLTTLACCALAMISAERYMALRIKRTQLAYELLIVLLDTRVDFATDGRLSQREDTSTPLTVQRGIEIAS